ncbi:MAG: YicC family protein [Gammaproteobacteria bacterium]
MIRSMTGFSSRERSFEFGRLTWEMRSVNHRYLEYGLRLPEEFRMLEPRVREVIARHVARGKVDATLRFHEAPGHGGSGVELNEPLARQLLDAHGRFAALAGLQQQPQLDRLMRWPGVVAEQLPDPEPLHRAALELLEETARDLQAGRAREGEQLAAMVRDRLDGVESWVAEVRGWLPEIRTALHARMAERAAELGQALEPERLSQEVAILAQKMDVDEELDRLDAHVVEARRTLELEEPVGRRLDFLMQEFNREANTLSSKSVDQRTTQASVELKVLIEQMREQVQNVE